VTLVASGGGVFEVSVDQALLFSKKEAGVFPEECALLNMLRRQAG